MNADEGEQPKRMSKKARKLASRLTVAELKQLVRRPDVVEVEEVSAADPRLLVYLKSYRNTVPVPKHWCSKRHYLQGRRGTEKTPFKLPGRNWEEVIMRLHREHGHFGYPRVDCGGGERQGIAAAST